ncbi:MAG: DUF3313 family protein [Halieaceae bacterium]
MSIKKIAAIALATITWLSAPGTTLAEDAASPHRFDDLVAIEDPRVHSAYVNPDADFSVFKRVAILDPFVAFRSNWQRDQNRSRGRNVRASDVTRIKADAAALFREVFVERLEAAGFDITTDAGDDVLVLRPAIIDLDITVPDVNRAGRGRTYSATNGAATLYIELIDSVTGDMLGRAADRQAARQAGGMMTWNNRVTNRAEARRMFGRWADKLVEFLHDHYEVKGKK